jgi:hypothetical protein
VVPRPAGSGAGGGAGGGVGGTGGGPGAGPQPSAAYGPPGGVSGAVRNAVKIGLWGSSEAGKTTFLAALRHSVGADGGIRGGRGPGRWGIMPMNTESAELMVKFGQLLVQGSFPESTVLNAPVPLQWLFVGDIEKSRFDHRLFKHGRLESKFLLDLLDVNGEAFADDPTEANIPARVSEQTIDHLTDAAGLIYLFDPLGEKGKRNAAQYVNRTVVELHRRYAAMGHDRPYLPHHVAVCITKCDDTRVFQRARDLGFVNEGPDGAQWIRDEHAEQFFDTLCSGRFWSERDEAGYASAAFVRKTLRGAFDPRKVTYHVTSSIGFRQLAGFDPDDYANYHEKANGRASIRGAINPINVLEPLVGLVQRIGSQKAAP